VKVRRVYDPPEPDGLRVLADLLGKR